MGQSTGGGQPRWGKSEELGRLLEEVEQLLIRPTPGRLEQAAKQLERWLTQPGAPPVVEPGEELQERLIRLVALLEQAAWLYEQRLLQLAGMGNNYTAAGRLTGPSLPPRIDCRG